MDKCISNANIFADLNFSIDMFDIFKTISSTTRIIFQAITYRVPYRNCLFENSTNELNKKIILKSQKIDSSNSFCKNKYNLFNKIQKVVYTIFAFKDNTSKRRENYLMKKVVIIELN